MRCFFTLLIPLASIQVGCGQTEEEIRKEFDQYEINEDEALDGIEVTACKCKQFDTNADGVITYTEFKAGRKGARPPKSAPPTAGTTAPGAARVPALAAGTKVEIDYQGVWYPGHIMEVNGNRYKIHYEGYGENWDSWVTKDKLRIPGSAQAATPARANPASNQTYSTGAYVAGYSPGLGWSYYYFLPGNRVARGCITGGLEYNDPAGINPTNLGTYTRSGNTRTINWDDGYTATGKFLSDGGFDLNGGIYAPEKRYRPACRETTAGA